MSSAASVLSMSFVANVLEEADCVLRCTPPYAVDTHQRHTEEYVAVQNQLLPRHEYI